MPVPAPSDLAPPTCTASAARPQPSGSAASPARTSRCPQATDLPTRPVAWPCYHADEPSAPPWCTGWIWSFGSAHQGAFLPASPSNCQVRSPRSEPCLSSDQGLSQTALAAREAASVEVGYQRLESMLL